MRNATGSAHPCTEEGRSCAARVWVVQTVTDVLPFGFLHLQAQVVPPGNPQSNARLHRGAQAPACECAAGPRRLQRASTRGQHRAARHRAHMDPASQPGALVSPSHCTSRSRTRGVHWLGSHCAFGAVRRRPPPPPPMKTPRLPTGRAAGGRGLPWSTVAACSLRVIRSEVAPLRSVHSPTVHSVARVGTAAHSRDIAAVRRRRGVGAQRRASSV